MWRTSIRRACGAAAMVVAATAAVGATPRTAVRADVVRRSMHTAAAAHSHSHSHTHTHQPQPQPHLQQQQQQQQQEAAPTRLRRRDVPYQSSAAAASASAAGAATAAAPAAAATSAVGSSSSSAAAAAASTARSRGGDGTSVSTAPFSRVRTRHPWVSHLERPWLFMPFARANDYEGVFTFLEERARGELRAAEIARLEERAARMEAARARGEEPVEEVDEHTLPWKRLSKKAKRRVRALLLSTDPPLRVLASVPRVDLLDAFQAFAVEGQEEGMEYVYRRLNQIGVPFDEEIASRWMAGIITAATRRRQAKAEEVLAMRDAEQAKLAEAAAVGALEAGQQFLAEATAATTAAAAATASGADSAVTAASSATTPASHSSKTKKPAPARPIDPSLSPADARLARQVSATDPASVSAMRSHDVSVGLPCTRLVRVQVETVMAWLERYGLIPSLRVVRQIFEALAIDNDLHGSIAFISRLHRMKYYVSGFTYAQLIGALAKHQNSEGAMFVFLHMEKAKFAPHSSTFNQLIQAFASLGDYTTAYKLMQDMQAHKLSPDNSTFASLIEACARADRMDLATEMLHYFKKNHSRLTRQKRINPVRDIKLIGIANAPDDEKVTVQLQLGRQPFESLMMAHLARRQLAPAIDILNEMMELDVRPSPFIYAQLMRECAAQSRRAEAKQLWAQLLSVGVVPTARLYMDFMVHAATLGELKHLYEEMVNGNTSGQTGDGSGDGGAGAAAEVVSSPSSFHGPLQPALRVYHMLIGAMVREGRLDMLPWLMAEMRAHRVAPTKPFLREVQTLLRAHQHAEHASLLWLTWVQRGELALTDEFIERLVSASIEEIEPQLFECRRIAAEAKARARDQARDDEADADATAAAANHTLDHSPIEQAEYTVPVYAEPTPADFAEPEMKIEAQAGQAVETR